MAFYGIWRFFAETRSKSNRGDLDLAGIALMTTGLLAFLSLLLMGGRSFAWVSGTGVSLTATTLLCGVAFYVVEQRAQDPLLATAFLRRPGFTSGNAAVFLSSFAIFALFAFAPLFIQGVMGRTPLQVGMGMLALSLGWSVGSLVIGQVVHGVGLKRASLGGALLLSLGCALPLFFGSGTTMAALFGTYILIGLGMGGVSLATLLVVQESVSHRDLGVSTSTHQLARTMGGTVGVGVCGGVVNLGLSRLNGKIPGMAAKEVSTESGEVMTRILQPETLAQLPPEIQVRIKEIVAGTMHQVQWGVFGAALLCLAVCLTISNQNAGSSAPAAKD
jgi:MFS family permease